MFIPKDKAYHFIAGLVAGSLALIASRALHPPGIAVFAVLGAALAGVGKEAWDYWQNTKAAKANPDAPPPHDVDLWDAVSTTLGGLAVAVLFTIHER